MYKVEPKGLNIKQNDRDVPDGFLQESINLQWRDGAYKPIPERLSSGITNASDAEIILHKVSDEDKINVLMFTKLGDIYFLKWHGTIENGVYTAKATSEFLLIPIITDFTGFSFTILNGIIYFMSIFHEFYYKLEFNEADDTYEEKDMYAWKELIPFYPLDAIRGKHPIGIDSHILQTRCGVILFRYTLVLKTGEEVLHSPIYATDIIAHNRSSSTILKDDPLTNIHTIINTNLKFNNLTVFNEEISAINFYATIPYYLNKVYKTTSASAGIYVQNPIDTPEFIGEVQRLAETPFYLVKTVDSPGPFETDNALMFYAGNIDLDIEFQDFNETIDCDFTKVNLSSIAAGEPMPIDNFTYHKIFGKLNSNNGRLIIDNPKTILSKGHARAFASQTTASKTGFYIDTEDGKREAVAYAIEGSFFAASSSTGPIYMTTGIISYPDSRVYNVGVSESSVESVALFKTRANKAHNLACAFSISFISFGGEVPQNVGGTIKYLLGPRAKLYYENPEIITVANPPLIDPLFYTSENRIQFSESGEFSVWPAINSYRVGEGKIMFVGDNSVDPANADFIAPLIIGTSDGVYSVNFDPTGAMLIQSITKAANMPALSSENIQIDQALIYVSDKGLIVINNGQLTNITEDYFLDQGNGDFLSRDQNNIYPNYALLTNDFFGGVNPYELTDIIDYMKGAIFAYDGRRNNLWCSNPGENFSLVYNLVTKQWGMSTYVFTEKVELFSILDTFIGDVYSRFLVKNSNGGLDILSGENIHEQVETHLLTRPIKIQNPDQYKKIERLISRCELFTDNVEQIGYFTFGLWGKQELNKRKTNIPLIAYKDGGTSSFPNSVRQDIPVGRQKGKFKTITILQGGKMFPESSIDGFDIVAFPVDNKIIR